MTTLAQRLEAIPPKAWPIALFFLMLVTIGGQLLNARSTFAKKDELQAELRKLKPSVNAARTASMELDRIQRASSELQGWKTSRIAIGENLATAARVRPNDMAWTRIVVQQRTASGGKEPHIAYRPRSRSTHLIIAGTIHGRASDLLTRTYLDELSAPTLFGNTFGKLIYPGLTHADGDIISATFTFSIEGQTPARRIDRSTPP